MTDIVGRNAELPERRDESTVRGSWVCHTSTRLLNLDRLAVSEDEVTTPGGTPARYEWVHARDLVRVAALTDNGKLWVVDQFPGL